MLICEVCTADSFTELMEINHDDEVVDTERFDMEMEEVTLDSMQPNQQEVAKRLTTSIVNTYLDTKDIAFERYVWIHIKKRAVCLAVVFMTLL